MTRLGSFAVALGFGILASGTVLAAGLSDLAPPPAPAAPAGGMVTSVNLASLKAVFDRANVPAEIRKEADGFSYVETSLAGNAMLLVPAMCENNDRNGNCAGVIYLSGVWKSQIAPDKIRDAAKEPRFATIIADGSGAFILRHTLAVHKGVGPDYLEWSIVQFSDEMLDFGKFLTAQGGAASGAGYAAKPSLAGNLGLVRAAAFAAEPKLDAGNGLRP